MAEITTQRIIEVDVRGAETLADFKAELTNMQLELQKAQTALQNDEITLEEYQSAVLNVKVAQQAYNAEMRIQVKENKSAKGSYNDLVNQLARLKEQWKNVNLSTEEGREEHKRLTKQINDVKNELNSLDHSIGNWQRNVGNYGNSIASVAGLFGSAGQQAGRAVTSVMGFTQSLKVMGATPVIALLSGLVSILQSVANAFKSSEQNADRLRIAFAPLNAVSQAFTRLMQDLAGRLAKVGEWLGKVADKWGLITDEMKVNQQLTKDEIALRNRQREVMVENARIELEVEENKRIARDKANTTLSERIEALTKASEGEKAILANELELAQEQFRIAQERAKLTANDTEANDKLAESEANLYRVRADYERGMTRITSALSSAILEARNAEVKSAEDTGVAIANIADNWSNRMDTTIAKAVELRNRLAEEMKQLNAIIAGQDKELTEEVNALLLELNTQFTDSINANTKSQADTLKDSLKTMNAVASGISSIMDDIAGAWQNDIKTRIEAGKISEREGEKEFENVKALQYANTWINTLAGMIGALADPTPMPWVAKAAQAGAVLSAGIANTIKIANTKLGQTQTASAVGQGLTQAPQVTMRVPEYRTLTGANDEKNVNTMTKVVLVNSELEALQEANRVKIAEASW